MGSEVEKIVGVHFWTINDTLRQMWVFFWVASFNVPQRFTSGSLYMSFKIFQISNPSWLKYDILPEDSVAILCPRPCVFLVHSITRILGHISWTSQAADLKLMRNCSLWKRCELYFGAKFDIIQKISEIRPRPPQDVIFLVKIFDSYILALVGGLYRIHIDWWNTHGLKINTQAATWIKLNHGFDYWALNCALMINIMKKIRLI